MKIIESFLTNNSCYKLGQKMTVRGLMLHSIGTPQPSADVFAIRWDDPAKEVCTHGMIDGNTGDVWQFLPWDVCGWHAGGAANKTHIGVEMCEPDCIKYKSNSATFTVKESDLPNAKNIAIRTYNSAVELFAFLCKTYALDPLADGVIIGHAEGHARGIASNHGDPEHLWRQLGLSYTMDTFRAAVANAVNGAKTPEKPIYITYTVRKGDTLSAIGAAYGVAWYKLAEFNALADPSLIYIGQKIKIPVDELPDVLEYDIYTVQAGDTLWKIAKQYLGAGWKYTEIMKYNGLASSVISAGDTLLIPINK